MEVQYDLSHYYRQTEGADTLSPTLQSSELWTPHQSPQRSTVSPERYQEYLLETPALARLPWGKEREYGGIGPISLPDDHRPKTEPPPLEAKGHKHYSYGGDPWPRGLPIQQYYDLTKLRKSAVRLNDDLYPKPPAASINAQEIYVGFPAEHPYHSHISKFAMFPSFRPPEEPARCTPPLHPQTPARGHCTNIIRKSRGNPYRHEVISIPSDSQKEALIWPGQHGYFHFPKCYQENGQIYYPIPPKTVAPNATYKPLEEAHSGRTVNLQRNLAKSQWLTSYNRSFTERGEMNHLQLDDHHEKAISNITGQTDENTEMKQTFLSTILQARPLEGRFARLREGRRPFHSREGKLDSVPESRNTDDVRPLDSDGDSDTDVPIHSVKFALTDGDTLPICNSRNNNAEKEFKCCSSAKCREPDFRKITDTIQSDSLYRRQTTPIPTSPELNSKTPKSIYYEDLQPGRQGHYMVFQNPFGRGKPWLKSDHNTEHADILKAREGPCILSLENRLNTPRTSGPGGIHDIELQRPRTALELQDSFSKSDVNKTFQQNFPERTRDLRDNCHSGRKHKFYGFDSFYFHN
ncbi:sperm-associated microtubule inner protein 4 [Ascaphus truei]|uniref:sperm-associated microtubule inner protein 4 n=1 Tax=Ascaphus truei TaxID=8439 RepID=UPI003F59F2B7